MCHLHWWLGAQEKYEVYVVIPNKIQLHWLENGKIPSKLNAKLWVLADISVYNHSETFTCLLFGFFSSSEIFQRKKTWLSESLEGMVCHFYSILVDNSVVKTNNNYLCKILHFRNMNTYALQETVYHLMHSKCKLQRENILLSGPPNHWWWWLLK